jgi:hypothetical protein
VDTDIITFNDARDEWSHANTVVPLPGERVLVSFRNISTVGIIDQRTGADRERALCRLPPELRRRETPLDFARGTVRKPTSVVVEFGGVPVRATLLPPGEMEGTAEKGLCVDYPPRRTSRCIRRRRAAR